MREVVASTNNSEAKYRRPLNDQQVTVLHSLYWYRFCTSKQLALSLNKNSHKTILLGKGYSAQFARMRQIDIFGGEERLVHDLLCLRSEAPRPDHALPRQHGTPAANLLSVRETEVLTLIAQGLLNKQIAADLGIVEQTVKFHRSRIMARMQTRTVAELMHLVARLDIDVEGKVVARPSVSGH